ncbi:pep a2 [Streptomyces sp. NPDC048664]|uniref:pep a2 n=1 Tax=Streptomyces sp. NPDC048664 TaxID=3154505 RepID=UPI0034157421
MKTAAPCYHHLDVELSPDRIGQVKRVLAAHLRSWDLEMLVEPFCQCLDALLHGIDAHAADKNATIEMWWNGQHLITAVQDSERDIRPHYAPAGCLARIAALSNGWGCCATGTGGKIIWFSQRARAGDHALLAPTAPAPSLRETRPLPRALPLTADATARERETVTAGRHQEAMAPA